MDNRWAILALLFAVRLTLAYQFQSVAAVSPLLIDAWAIDYAELGLLVSLYMLPGVVIALPGGMIGGRFGDRATVVAGLALMALGGAVTGFADTYAAAVIGRLVAGVGGVLLNVLMTKMVMDWFAGREIVAALAVFITSWPGGIALALYTSAGLAELVSLPAVFFLTSALSLLGLAGVWKLYRLPPGRRGGGRLAATARLLPREIWLTTLVTLVWMSYSMLYLLLMSFAPALLASRGLSSVEAGDLTGVASVCFAVSTFLSGFFADWLKRPALLVLVSLSLIIAAFAALPSFATAAWIFAAIGVIGGMPQGVLKSLPVETLRARARAAGMGLHFTIHYAGFAGIPPLVGWVADLSGGVEAAMYSGAAFGALALGLYFFSRAELRRLPLPPT